MPDKSPSKRIARCIVLVGEILTDSAEGGASFHLSRWPHSDTDVNAKCYLELKYRCNFLIGINKAEIVVVTHLFELLLTCLFICKVITPIKTHSELSIHRSKVISKAIGAYFQNTCYVTKGFSIIVFFSSLGFKID